MEENPNLLDFPCQVCPRRSRGRRGTFFTLFLSDVKKAFSNSVRNSEVFMICYKLNGKMDVCPKNPTKAQSIITVGPMGAPLSSHTPFRLDL